MARLWHTATSAPLRALNHCSENSENITTQSAIFDLRQPDLRHADDGPVYVDIFSAFKFSGDLPPRMESTRKDCRDHIQAKLDASMYVPPHYKKLQWLANIWNRTVEHKSGRVQWIVAPAQRDFRRRDERQP
jgi:hypothetical protein